MKVPGFLLVALFFAVPSISFSGGGTYFRNLEEIMRWVVTELSAGGKETIDQKKIEIQNTDLNGDGKKDYWLLYPELACGSQGCYGFVFLSTEKGYCLAEAEIGQHHFAKRNFPKSKCQP